MAKSGKSTLITISSVVGSGENIGKHIRNFLKELPISVNTTNGSAQYEYYITGSQLLSYDNDEGISKDMERTDGVRIT